MIYSYLIIIEIFLIYMDYFKSFRLNYIDIYFQLKGTSWHEKEVHSKVLEIPGRLAEQEIKTKTHGLTTISFHPPHHAYT